MTPVASHPVPKGWRGQAGCWWLPFSVLLGARRPVSPFPPCTLRHLPPQGNPGHYALFYGIKMRAEGKGALQVSVASGRPFLLVHVPWSHSAFHPLPVWGSAQA